MNKLSTTLFFLLVASYCIAQISLKGTVIDAEKQSIPYASIILLNEDSTLYKGTTSDENGLFDIQVLKEEIYTLHISFIGYKKFEKKLAIKENINFENITLEEDVELLNTVEVAVKRPTVQRKVDRLVFHVENTILSSGNAWEVLKKTPGLIINQEKILIKNSQNIIILINDKRVYLSNSELKELLEGTSAVDITSIEIITNPPAKYEAEGTAVLNIKMKKNIATGYKASLGGSFRKARFTSGNIYTSQYYKNNWLNIYGNYSHSLGQGNRLEEEFINFSKEGVNETFHSNLDRNSFYRTHNFKLNSEFTLNTKSSLTLGGQMYYSPNRKIKNLIDSEILINDTQNSSFITQNNAKDFNQNLSLHADYEIHFNDKKTLNIIGYFTDYKEEGNQLVTTDFYTLEGNPYNNNTFTTFSKQYTSIYSSQADYKNILSEDVVFEAGGKYANVSSRSDLEHLNLINNINVLDETRTNSFLYNEENISGYVSYESQWKKISFKSGLRGEYTMLKGNSITLQEVNSSYYFKVFPTLYLQYKINESHQFGLNYGKRISRPNYSFLNPFKFYYTDYSFYTGSPNLQPSISHNIELQYTLSNKYNFDLYYNLQNNYITEINFQDNSNNELRYSFVNVPKNNSLGISMNTNFNLSKRWSLYTQHHLYENKSMFRAVENNNQLVENSLLGYYGYISTSYTFLKDESLIAELSAYIVTDGVQGSMRIEGSHDLSIGLSKKILKKRATLTLQISDILKSQIVKVSTNYLNQNNYFIDNQETQYIRLGFRYNFGNQSLKKKRNKTKVDEQNRL